MPFDLTSQTKMSELLGPMREIGAPLFIASGGDDDETPLFAIVIADGTDVSRRLLAATENLLDEDAATAPETVTDLPTEEIRRRFLTVQREHDGKGFLSPESRVWALDTLEDLLEETERLQKRVQELEPFAECYLQGRNHAADDVIATVGGTVEDKPVNRTNWLQRLRQLAETEQQLEAVREQKDGAYRERNQLVAALSKCFPACISRHPEEDRTWEDDWRWIVFIHLPTGQASWHIHDSEYPLFSHLMLDDVKWDGHTTEEKYRRLAALSQTPASKRTVQEARRG